MLHKKRKPSTFTPSSSFADCKRNAASNNNMLHSKSTYFYGWSSLAPSVCGLALLFGLGIIFNPAINSTEEVYAETVTANPTDYSSISLTISNNGTELNSGDTVSTNVEPGLISYISNNLKIDAKKINRFYVGVQAAEDGTTELTGTNNYATIAPVGSNKIPTATDENGFGDNTWGFALGEANADNSSMSYNSLPAYGTSTTPQYSSATNLADGTYNLKLTFAAKINADKPSDHYTTKAMVSVAADAKAITLLDINKMQDMTADICKNTASGASKQLIDDRTASGLGETKYWVAKLKDGKCWMTQNLDLALAQGDKLNPTDTDVASEYIIPTLNNYADPGMYNYKVNAANSDYFPVSDGRGCGNPALEGCAKYFEIFNGDISDSEKAHYLIGNYYQPTIATAGQTAENSGSICPKSWKLPTKSEYNTLINNIPNTNATTNTIRTAPYYFIPAGYYLYDYDLVAYGSGYWTNTPTNDGSGFFGLSFNAGELRVAEVYDKRSGYSVRCVAR